MATRKKKTETNTNTSEWPKVTVGTHLTITTYENGKTELNGMMNNSEKKLEKQLQV